MVIGFHWEKLTGNHSELQGVPQSQIYGFRVDGTSTPTWHPYMSVFQIGVQRKHRTRGNLYHLLFIHWSGSGRFLVCCGKGPCHPLPCSIQGVSITRTHFCQPQSRKAFFASQVLSPPKPFEYMAVAWASTLETWRSQLL